MEVNGQALAAGVRPGLSAAQALARCSNLELFHPVEEAEEAAGRLLFARCSSLAPRLERTLRGRVTIDAMGREAGGLPMAVRAVVEGLAEAGLQARAGVGPTPFLARVAALRASPVCVLTEGETVFREGVSRFDLRDFLAETMLAEALGEEGIPGLLEVLDGWGVRTLADFRALDRSAVVARLGAEGGRAHDEVSGRRCRLLRLDMPPPVFEAGLELEEPIERLEPLLFIIRRLLETLCAEMGSAVKAANALKLELSQERGPVWVSEIALPEPSSRVDVLFAVLQTRLEGVRTETAVVAVRLKLEPGEVSAGQRDLFRPELSDPHCFAETLGRLRALLGAEGCGCPCPEDTHGRDAFSLNIPEVWAEKSEENEGGGGMMVEEDKPAEVWRRGNWTSEILPVNEVRGPALRHFRPSRRVEVVADGGVPKRIEKGNPAGLIEAVRGPWIYSGSWWEGGGWNRVEWDISVAGGIYRLAQEGGGNWELEGMYD